MIQSAPSSQRNQTGDSRGPCSDAVARCAKSGRERMSARSLRAPSSSRSKWLPVSRTIFISARPAALPRLRGHERQLAADKEQGHGREAQLVADPQPLGQRGRAAFGGRQPLGDPVVVERDRAEARARGEVRPRPREQVADRRPEEEAEAERVDADGPEDLPTHRLRRDRPAQKREGRGEDEPDFDELSLLLAQRFGPPFIPLDVGRPPRRAVTSRPPAILPPRRTSPLSSGAVPCPSRTAPRGRTRRRRRARAARPRTRSGESSDYSRP